VGQNICSCLNTIRFHFLTSLKNTYRVIHKSFRNFRIRLHNNQDRHSRKDISSTCKVGQKLGVTLPLLTCSPSAWPSRLLYRRVHNFLGGAYELPCIKLTWMIFKLIWKYPGLELYVREKELFTPEGHVCSLGVMLTWKGMYVCINLILRYSRVTNVAMKNQ